LSGAHDYNQHRRCCKNIGQEICLIRGACGTLSTPRTDSSLYRLSRTLSVRSRLIRFVALLHYVFLATGMPLPIRAEKDASTPFPCLSRGCSCRTAEQCAKSCCCFSQSEQIEWYRERGLRPPPTFDEHPTDVAPSRSPIRTKKSCCSTERPKTDSDCCKSASPQPLPQGCNISLSDEAGCRGILKGGSIVFVALSPQLVSCAVTIEECGQVRRSTCGVESHTSSPSPPPPRA